ncbi:hypothetical protein [Sediminitomix flava]|uniref:Uncharacterized protein n=1 Tax=Sediminitomix flava TaxID=379075 RepID=A0A315ZJL7_SEDFL|nr:hypothetical protein [Sediminitomix flava]PWJ34091.1 hypothetical protein BC781_1111 [Sediminitomix flava]
MKFVFVSSLILLLLQSLSLSAQEFNSIQEVENYMKTHDDFKKRMDDGWYKIYFVEDKKEENLIEGFALLHDGFISQVYSKDANYILKVQSNNRVHHGKGTFYDLVYEETDNMAEVIPHHKFSAYFIKSTVEESNKSPHFDGHWMAWTDWSGVNKNHGYFIFLKESTAEEYQLVGYLDKHTADQPNSCVPSEGDWLYLPMKQGEYDYLAVKNSVKVNRHMPTKSGKLRIKADNCPKLYLSKKLKS